MDKRKFQSVNQKEGIRQIWNFYLPALGTNSFQSVLGTLTWTPVFKCRIWKIRLSTLNQNLHSSLGSYLYITQNMVLGPAPQGISNVVGPTINIPFPRFVFEPSSPTHSFSTPLILLTQFSYDFSFFAFTTDTTNIPLAAQLEGFCTIEYEYMPF